MKTNFKHRILLSILPALYILAFLVPALAVEKDSPDIPVIMHANASSYDSIELEWTPCSDVDGYEIYRYDDEAGEFSLADKLDDPGTTKYTDTGLLHDTGYAYKILSYKKEIMDQKDSELSDIGSATPELQPTDIISVKNTGNSNIIIYWEAVQEIDGYELFRSTDPFEDFEKIYACDNPDIVSYTDRNLKNNTTYHYKIQTFSIVDGEKIVSDLSGFESEKSIGQNTQGLEDKSKNNIDNADSNAGNIDGYSIEEYKVEDSFYVKSYAYSGGGVTATGQKCQVGRIAVDPGIIPLGTWLYVEGYGICQACDTGGDIIGKTIDVYMNTELECRIWGVKYPKVYILTNRKE